MQDRERYGTLIQDPSIKINRQYFREMVKLLGVRVLYRAPKPNKHYTTYGEIDSNFESPILVGCIFDEHPNQQTMKKLNWVSELQEQPSIITVDYDLPNLQVGSIFIIPSGLDNSKGRLFSVTNMFTSIIYPASITCQIVPEWENTLEDETTFDYSDSSFTLINVEEDED